MNQDQIMSLVRTFLKTVGASIVTKGYTDSSTVEAIIGGVVAIVGIVLSHYTHKEETKV